MDHACYVIKPLLVVLMVAARLINRVIDLGTMLILARLLSPSNFGLVAIAMTVVSIPRRLSNFLKRGTRAITGVQGLLLGMRFYQ
jgi:Polysaccharide biosynthesis protein